MTDIDRWLTREEVADIARFSPKTLANWAAMKPPKGPKIVRVGRQVRYLASDVQAWQEAQGDLQPPTAAA